MKQQRPTTQPILSGTERIDTALKWLELSDANQLVVHTLSKMSTERTGVSVHCVALAALCMCLELRMKGIITLENRSFPYDHNLERLFNCLTLESRKFIDARAKPDLLKFSKNIKSHLPNFPAPINAIQMLRMYQGAYNSLRYGSMNDDHRLFWPHLAAIMAERAMDLCPEWKETRTAWEGNLMFPKEFI